MVEGCLRKFPLKKTQKTGAVVLALLLLVLLVVFDRSVSFTRILTVHKQSNSTQPQTKETHLKAGAGDWLYENPVLQQNDETVINYIRKYHMTPPSPSTKPYNLKKPRGNPSLYWKEIARLVKQGPGFFIEAGANDGQYLSNTLELERKYGWTGLLIEPNPFMLVKLRLRNRKAWIADVCLSLKNYPQKVRFSHHMTSNARHTHHFEGMGIIEHSAENPVPPTTKRLPEDYVFAGYAECFPLFSILASINVTVVDYFSLDIEGVEVKVLKAIPFHLLTIKVFSIEYDLVPEGERNLTLFLESKGYQVVFKKRSEVFAIHKDYINEPRLRKG